MMIKILQNQLEVANATIANLNETIKSMEARFNATIDELKKTNANLESLLKERDESLGKAASQMRGLKATYLPVSVSAMTHSRHKESRVLCPAILFSIYRGEDSCMLQVSDAAGRRLC